jgi:V8-like Glu-specific endopeptidase
MKSLPNPVTRVCYFAAGMVLFSILATGQPGHPTGFPLCCRADSGVHENRSNEERLVWQHVVTFPNASWIRLKFAVVSLPGTSQLEITSFADDGCQVHTAESMRYWFPNSAYFNGEAVSLRLFAGPGTAGVRVALAAVHVGVPLPGGMDEICGPSDDRGASQDKRVGRLLDANNAPCTAWLASPEGVLLTAGHCMDPIQPGVLVEFNVGPSTSSGSIQHPGPEDQYPVIETVLREDQGPGCDWAVIRIGPNSRLEHAIQRQGDYIRLDLNGTTQPANLRVTGFGKDSGTPGPTNFTNRTHVGPLTGTSLGTCGETYLLYRTDTRGGNSGSPVIDEASGEAIAIHTHAGCTGSNPETGSNKGTQLSHKQLLKALAMARVKSGGLAGGIAQRVSIDSAGKEARGWSSEASLSADGHFVAFASSAKNLVPNDTNNSWDVFVHDRQSGKTRRVSVSSAGREGNDRSWKPSISGDGRFIAFDSISINLVPNDTNGHNDVFVHDRQTGITTRVSVDSTGNQGNVLSWVASISSDGRHVAFESFASNLVPNDTNAALDVFVHDRQTRTTTRVSIDSAGKQSNNESGSCSISCDGRFVAFSSLATNLVPGDTNSLRDVFVHDRQTGATTRVSVDSAGREGNGSSDQASISADGRYVAFYSMASNLVPNDNNGWWDVFVHDRQTGQVSLVSVDSTTKQGNGLSITPSISADGRYIAFSSLATDLVLNDTNGSDDIFVHDCWTGQTTRFSVDSAGKQGNDHSRAPSISSDGRSVAFQSLATNLVFNDTNQGRDIFVHAAIPSPTLTPIGNPRVGNSVALSLWSPDDLGRPYVIGSSLGYQPGMRVDTRDIPLNLDLLLGMSWTAPHVFQDFFGILDGQGQALAFIHIPAEPMLGGITIYTAFVTTHPPAPSGISGISNVVELKMVP